MILGRTADIKTWFFHIFFFYKENIFRKLFPLMIVLSIYCLSIIYLNQTWKLVSNIIDRGLDQFHVIFSFVLAFFISFRVNTSYNRWWEARILWGSLVNNSRNLAMKVDVFVGLETCPDLENIIANYPTILKFHLRRDRESIEKLFISYGYSLNKDDNPLVVLNHKLFSIVNQLRRQDKITLEQFLVIDKHVSAFMDITGACERILNTRPPSAFALAFPFGWVDSFGLISIPMLLVIVYILFGLEVLAEEMEDPFGHDDHDLPLNTMAINISKNIHSIEGYNVD